MLMSYRNGQTGIVLRIKVADATRPDGGGLTGLTPSAPGLAIATLSDAEATPVVYRAADGAIESITTLGTYEAPTAGRCRFREIDPTNFRGVYEIHLANARYAVAGARSLLVALGGAANAAETEALVALTVVDPYAAHGGFDPWGVALPAGYAAGTAGARVGQLDAAISTRLAAAGYAPAPTPAQVAAAVWDEPAAGHVVAGSFAGRLDASISSRLAGSGYTAPPSAAAVAAAVWDEPAAGHGAAGSFGARLDASISSRSTYAGGPVAAVAQPVTLAAAGLDAIEVEPGINARQALAPILAALAGTVGGAGTGTIQIQAAGGTTTRITATTDAAGNRAAVTLALPA